MPVECLITYGREPLSRAQRRANVRPMRHILTKLLILTTLAFSVLSAWDQCPIDSYGHCLLSNTLSEVDHTGSDGHTCDHCCHLSSHLTGVHSASGLACFPNAQAQPAVAPVAVVTHHTEPLLHPPTV